MQLKNKRHKVLVEDMVFCRLDKELKEKVKELFAYPATWWKDDKSRTYIKNGKQHFVKDPQHSIKYYFGKQDITSNSNIIRIGLLPKLRQYCREEKIPIRIVYRWSKDMRECPPELDPNLGYSIEFRPDQLQAILQSRKSPFGRIIAPTGSGKTITMLGICSMYPNQNILILAHTKDLVSQIYEEAKKYSYYLPEPVFPSGAKGIRRALKQIEIPGRNKNRTLITTIQSMARVDPMEYFALFEIIIVDEVHHVTRPVSQYGKVLDTCMPARRYGFTATIPTAKPDCFYNEGLFGPVIAELTVQQAIRQDIIATPSVTLLNVPYDARINQQCGFNYQKVYTHALVENLGRNQLIVDQIKLSMAFNHSTLIIVEKIEHGKIIKKLLWQQLKYKVHFVYGHTTKDARLLVKNNLKNGKLLVVICSRIWMEGINIPSLRRIIYAAGLKERKKVIQAMGRGLRTAQDKEKIELIDFLDPYKYLSQHSIMRMAIYNEEKWI